MSLQMSASQPGQPANRFFDLSELQELRGTFGPAECNALLDRFAEELPQYDRALADAVAQRDLSTVMFTVHTLRGMALSLSCRGLANLCDWLRTTLEHGDADAARRAALVLTQAYRRALDELDALRRPGGVLAA